MFAEKVGLLEHKLNKAWAPHGPHIVNRRLMLDMGKKSGGK
jgi:hypothetical protein